MQEVFKAGKIKREEVFIATKLWNNSLAGVNLRGGARGDAKVRRAQRGVFPRWLGDNPFEHLRRSQDGQWTSQVWPPTSQAHILRSAFGQPPCCRRNESILYFACNSPSERSNSEHGANLR
jgi:hypothetical protein